MHYLVASNDDNTIWDTDCVGVIGSLPSPEEFEHFIRRRRGRDDETLYPIVGEDAVRDVLEFDGLNCYFEGSMQKLVQVNPHEEYISEMYILVAI